MRLHMNERTRESKIMGPYPVLVRVHAFTPTDERLLQA